MFHWLFARSPAGHFVFASGDTDLGVPPLNQRKARDGLQCWVWMAEGLTLADHSALTGKVKGCIYIQEYLQAIAEHRSRLLLFLNSR